MTGKMVEFQSNGQRASGYLSLPESGKGAGVLVIQEWWGLVPHIKSVADRLAQSGFVALAPDLYHGQATQEPNEAQKLMLELDIARAGKDMAGAIAFLKSHRDVDPKKVGCIGFCMGGGMTLHLAATGKIDAAVPFYGGLHKVPDWRGVQCPIQGHYAEHDGPTDALPAVREGLQKAGKQATFHIYKGTRHAFFNDARPEVYDPSAAQVAWVRTLEFLRKTLR